MKYRVWTIDHITKRALVAFMAPGEKVCANIRWVSLGELMLAAAIASY